MESKTIRQVANINQNGHQDINQIDINGRPLIRTMPLPPLDVIRNYADTSRQLLITKGKDIVVCQTIGSDIPTDVYIVNPQNGLMSNSEATIQRVVNQVAQDIWIRAAEEEGDELKGIKSWHNKLKNNSAEDIRKAVGGVIDASFPDVEIKRHDDINIDMSVIGTPQGVLPIRQSEYQSLAGFVYSPEEGRKRFITRSIPYPFNPEAHHPAVDKIFPSPDVVDHHSRIGFICRWFGWHLTHKPRRDFLALITAPGAGKSTIVNALEKGFGEYMKVVRQEGMRKNAFTSSSSHNGDMRHFGGGTRWVVFMELSQFLPKATLNNTTGGDRKMPIREIYKADKEITVTAGTVLVGNTPNNNGGKSVGASIGLDGDDDITKALLDRARMCALPRREGDDDDKDLLNITTSDGDKLFSQSVVARMIEWANVVIDDEVCPEATPEMLGDLWQQRNAEKGLYISEFIPEVLTQDRAEAEVDAFNSPMAGSSYHIYQKYLSWHEANGEGKPEAQRRITRDVEEYYQIDDKKKPGSVRRDVSCNRVEGDNKATRPKTAVYEDYYMRQ